MNEAAMAAAIEAGCEVPDWRKQFSPSIAHHLTHNDAYAPPGYYKGGRPIHDVWMRRNPKGKGRRRNTVETSMQARIFRVLQKLRARAR